MRFLEGRLREDEELTQIDVDRFLGDSQVLRFHGPNRPSAAI